MTAAAAGPVAFGFRVHGLEAGRLLDARRPDWPVLRVDQRVESPRTARSHLGDGRAQLALKGGDWLLLDRDQATATYLTAEAMDEDEMIHPCLAPAAALMARWLGREAFHAGAVVAGDGGAWGVIGSNEAGKSTILAALAVAGRPVLTDDLLVVDGGLAYAGPRCIDLRELHVVGGTLRDRVRPVRAGTRHRLDLPSIEAVAPLRGWFFLEWGSEVEALPCPAATRFRRLSEQRRWATHALDPRVLLELASLPAWTLRRPRGGRHLDAVLACLDELTAGAGPGSRRSRDVRRRPKAA